MDSDIIGFSFHRGLYADVEHRRVLRDHNPLDMQLTKMEFDVLKFFLENPNVLISRGDVKPLNDVSRVGRLPVDHYVAIINRKLGLQPNEIFAVTRGTGFTLETHVRPTYAKDREQRN